MVKRFLVFVPLFLVLYLPFLIFIPYLAEPISFSERLLDALRISFLVSLLSSSIAVLLGLLLAMGIEKHRSHVLAKALLHLPMVLPDIVMALGILSLYRIIHLELGLESLMVGHVFLLFPYAALNLSRSLISISPEVLDAARILGSHRFHLFFAVKLPMVFPDLMRTFILAAMISFDDVVYSFFLSGPGSTNLSLYSYSLTKIGIKPELAQLSLFIICALVSFTIIGLVYEKFKVHHSSPRHRRAH